jgi:hypothetical protein
MPIRSSGGVFNDQMLTGSLAHYVVCGADFSGAINQYGQPVPFSAAEIIFNKIEGSAYVDIMNPNEYNLSFALEADRSTWDEISLTTMIQSLGTNVGEDHVNCSVCTVKRVPYIWGCGSGGATSFLELTDTPDTYAGAAGYVVTVNNTQTGLIFSPVAPSNTFSTIASPFETSFSASGADTLTFKAGSNMVITTDPFTKSVLFSSIQGAGSDYIPVLPGEALFISSKYYVVGPGAVTLPIITGSGYAAGSSVIITKPVGQTVTVNRALAPDIINTDLGSTDSIIMDSTEQCIFVFDGSSTWNLQIGSTT